MKLFKKYPILLILILLGVVVFIRGLYFLDPDFGWHLRAGEVIIKSGIQKTDPFSYSMPSFPFIDHEWLSNVLIFSIFKTLGTYALSFIFSVVFVFSLFFAIPKKYKNYSIVPLILAGAVMVSFSGIRTQVETWFFLGLLLKLFLDNDLWKKWKYFIPLIFLPWVNLHGGFAVGIGIIFVIFLAKSIERKKIALTDLKIFLASILVTFVNPYGPRIWYEIWMQFSDTTLRTNIAEWTPGVFHFDVTFCVLASISFFFILIYRKKFRFYEIAVYTVLLLMAISSARHIPLWALATLAITPKAFFYFMEQINKHKESRIRFNKIKIILAIAFLAVFVYEISLNLMNIYNTDRYPVKAVDFLDKQNIQGNLFSIYDVGGYLIWKLPQKREFIDGRMPSWRREGYFPKESNYAYGDYLKMLGSDKFFLQQLDKYNVHYVLFPKIAKENMTWLGQKLNQIENKIFPSNQDVHVLSEDLRNLGMTKIYDDNKYVIYKR